MKLWPISLVAAAIIGVTPNPASAFGLKAHLWIGQRILDELKDNCHLRVRSKTITLSKELCRSILDNPGAFLAGVIGPDMFPDFLAGQKTVHPGVSGNWQTSDWLRHMYDGAAVGDQMAFSAGYLVHAAGDTFAHTYVNGYTGNVYPDTGQYPVRIRHIVLERYIDEHLRVGVPSVSNLVVPADFIRDRLIFNSDAANASKKAGATEIAAMYATKQVADSLGKSFDGLEIGVSLFITKAVTLGIELQTNIVNGRGALAAARVSLKAHEAALQTQRHLLDEAKREFDAADAAAKVNDALIAEGNLEAQVAQNAIDSTERAADAAIATRTDILGKIANLQGQLANVPATVTNKVCSALSKFDPVGAVPCKLVTKANKAYTDVIDLISGLQRQLNDAQSLIDSRATSVAADVTRKQVALHSLAVAMSSKAALDAATVAAKAAFHLEVARLGVESDLNVAAHQKVDELDTLVSDLTQKILEIVNVVATLRALLVNTHLLSGLTNEWRNELNIAASEYIKTSLDFAKGVVQNPGGILEAGVPDAYVRWFTCYGSAFTAAPQPGARFHCSAIDTFNRIDNAQHEFVMGALPEPFKAIFDKFIDNRRFIESVVKQQTKNDVLDLVRILDAPQKEYLDLLLSSQNGTVDKLREVYATEGNPSGSKLLIFTDVTHEIDADTGMINGEIDPTVFHALDYALRLSKIALLDKAGMKRLVWELGGDPDLINNQPGIRYSILMQSLRSIDGNQQWQPYGLPYPRSSGDPVPADAGDRHYGWGPSDDQGGMPLFVNKQLRKTVFSWIFPESMTGAVASRPEMQLPAYKFPSCPANPFPVTFTENGSPALEDVRCSAPKSTRAHHASFGLKLRRFWRGIGSSLGMAP